MAEGMLIEVIKKLDALHKSWEAEARKANHKGDNRLFQFDAGGASALYEAKEEIMELVGMKPVDINHKA